MNIELIDTYLNPNHTKRTVGLEIAKEDYEALVIEIIQNEINIDVSGQNGLTSYYDPESYNVLTEIDKDSQVDGSAYEVLGEYNVSTPHELTKRLLKTLIGRHGCNIQAKPLDEDIYIISIPYNTYNEFLKKQRKHIRNKKTALKLKEKEQKDSYNTSDQDYKGISLKLLAYDPGYYNDKKAKRFTINGTIQKLWIPNKHLTDEGLIKPNENIDYVLRRAQGQLICAGIKGPIPGVMVTQK